MRPVFASPRPRRVLGLIAAAVAGAAVALPAAGSGATTAPAPDTLAAGATLASGQSLASSDGHYAVVMQSTGNLVEQTGDGRVLWSSSPAGNSGAHAVMQTNGSLVIEAPGGTVEYSTNSRSAGCPRLVLQDDGNLVIYGETQPAWANGVIQTTLWAGDQLQPGWSIHARPETAELRMRPDGDLVLVDGAGRVLWSTQTAGHPGARALMQPDGNFVVYGSGGKALWSSNTTGHRNAHLTVRSDGDLVLLATDGAVLWSSQTAGRASGGSLAPAAPPPASCPAPGTHTTTTTTTPTSTTPPPTPVSPAPVTTPVPAPAPAPTGPRALRIRMAIGWTWNRSVTRVVRVRVGSAPGRITITLRCSGRACPRRGRSVRATGLRALHRLLAHLSGHRFRAGQGLLVSFSAPGYRVERILIRFRWGRLPTVALLGRR